MHTLNVQLQQLRGSVNDLSNSRDRAKGAAGPNVQLQTSDNDVIHGGDGGPGFRRRLMSVEEGVHGDNMGSTGGLPGAGSGDMKDLVSEVVSLRQLLQSELGADSRGPSSSSPGEGEWLVSRVGRRLLSVMTGADVMTHSAASGTTPLTVSSSTSGVDIQSASGQSVNIKPGGSTTTSTFTSGYADIESIRFTDAAMGIDGDPNIITLTSSTATVDGTLAATTVSGAVQATTLSASDAVSLSQDTQTVTHSGSTSLTITSTSGFVQVENVQFAGAAMRVSGAGTNLITLTDGNAEVTGAMEWKDGSTTKAKIQNTASVGGAAPKNYVLELYVGALPAGNHPDASKELYVNGDIYASGTSTSASDARFKEKVREISGDDALNAVRRVSPVTFNFKNEEFPSRNFPHKSKLQAGVIAQDVEKVLPHLVETAEDGYKSVAYDRLGVYAAAAAKELDRRMSKGAAQSVSQADHIVRLERHVAAQEDRIVQLEKLVDDLLQANVGAPWRSGSNQVEQQLAEG